MNHCDPTSPPEPARAHLIPRPTPRPPIAESSGRAGAALPARPASSPVSPASVSMAEQPRRPAAQRLLSNRRNRWLMAAALMSAVIGISAACATSSGTATSASATATNSGTAGRLGSGGGASNARSGPASGGSSGTVSIVSPSSFTVSTSAGQKVTVNETSSTTYQNGATPISASAITPGEDVFILGTVGGTTITAAQVIVQPIGSGSATSSGAGVIPFQPGAPSVSKQVGQVPANYSEGSGTITSGTTAFEATAAALAAYGGGIVDRVVQLSNGEYEVHNIGVNWPHHIFVDQNFKVVGAN